MNSTQEPQTPMSLLSPTDNKHVQRSASQIRSQFQDSTVGFFRGSLSDFMQTGYEFVFKHPALVTDTELDLWERRPGGNLVVGTSRPLLARLISGEDLKSIATGTVREAAGLLHYLNLSQLMHIRMKSLKNMGREGKIAIPELQDFKNQIDDAIGERIVSRMIEAFGIGWEELDDQSPDGNPDKLFRRVRSSRVQDLACSSEAEPMRFSIAEKKFLGNKLIQYIGALTSVKEEGYACGFTEESSTWFIFCGTAIPEDTSIPPRGVFIIWPHLKTFRMRPEPHTSVYALANHAAGAASGTSTTSWQIFCASGNTSIHELVRLTLSFRGTAAPSRAKGSSYKIGRAEGASMMSPSTYREPSTPATDVPSSTARSMSMIDSPVVKPEEEPEVAETPEQLPELEIQAEEEAGDEEYEYGYENEEYMMPMEYDEAVPVYYDAAQGSYFYYGNIIWYDPEGDPWCYYYYDWDQEDYCYADEETQGLLGQGAVPIWDNESQQYYSPEDWAAMYGEEGGEEEATGEEEVAEEEPTGEEEVQPVEVEPTLLEKVELKVEPETAASVETAAEEVTPPPVVVEETPAAVEEVAPPAAVEAPAAVEPKEVSAVPSTEEEIEEVEYDEEPEPSTTTTSKILAPSAVKFAEKSTVRPPARRRGGEYFQGSIDTFNSSESMLFSHAMPFLLALFRPQEDLLREFAQRNNGVFKVGRNKKTIEGLISGAMELKALTASSCSDVAANLNELNLVQLLHIRKSARNSAWDKTPLPAMRTFAMKTDALIGERFCRFLLDVGSKHEGASPRRTPEQVNELIAELGSNELRNMGMQALCVIGAMSQIKNSKEKIWGKTDYVKPQNGVAFTDEELQNIEASVPHNWWFIPKSPVGTVTCPRGNAEVGSIVGLFFNFPNFVAQFDRPTGVQTVYRLVAGRQTMAYYTWDVLEIQLAPAT